MQTRERLELWKKELRKIDPSVQISEDVNDEGTTEEEFYFFIRSDRHIAFYVFWDDWGPGVGLKFEKSSRIWYLEDLGISDDDIGFDFMFRIMTDVLKGAKLFLKDTFNEVRIDFRLYKEVKVFLQTEEEGVLSFEEL